MNKLSQIIGLKYFIVIIIYFFLSACSEAQVSPTPNQILKLMDPVKEGQHVDENAWLISIEGDTLSYKEFKGKWLLIDYWTAGCIPCIKEFPILDKYYQTIDKSKLEIISLSVDGNIKRWKKARNKYDFQMPKYYAGSEINNPFLSINFQLMKNKDGSQKIVTLTPQYVLISPDGLIVDKDIPKPSDGSFGDVIEGYIN